jgi:LysM repeat protein
MPDVDPVATVVRRYPLMKPLHAARACSILGLAALALCPTSACQTKIEEQDAFKNQADRIDRVEKDMDAIRRQLSVIDRDLQQVSLDVSQLATGSAGVNPQTVGALEQRAQKMDGTLKTIGETVATFDARIQKLERAITGNSTRIASLTETPPREQPETAKTALMVSRKNGTKAAAEPAGVEEKSSAACGVYHQVCLGETIEQIARTYKVPATTIQAANQLPRGRTLIAGQQIYVPRGR